MQIKQRVRVGKGEEHLSLHLFFREITMSAKAVPPGKEVGITCRWEVENKSLVFLCFCMTFIKLPLCYPTSFLPSYFLPPPLVLLRTGVIEQYGGCMASSQRHPSQLKTVLLKLSLIMTWKVHPATLWKFFFSALWCLNLL